MKQSMEIDGGLVMNSFGTERYMSDKPPSGRKVKFLGKNGYNYELSYAKKLFNEGVILTVREIYVYGFSSLVEFVEFPSEKFNTVMFEDIK